MHFEQVNTMVYSSIVISPFKGKILEKINGHFAVQSYTREPPVSDIFLVWECVFYVEANND